jgi:hypothetical protein
MEQVEVTLPLSLVIKLVRLSGELGNFTDNRIAGADPYTTKQLINEMALAKSAIDEVIAEIEGEV